MEENFPLRSKISYDRECSEIENAANDTVRNYLKITYGINKRSAFCSLPNFDITKQLPQDIMHSLLEGNVQYEIRLMLLHFVTTGLFTLQQINGSINSHTYGSSEMSNKPGPLRDSVFFGSENYKLKYNASQTRLFLRLLPFIIGPFINFEDPYYLFLIKLIKTVHIIFSPVIKLETIHYLKDLITENFQQFKDLFSDKNILPKQHYLLNIPETIKLLETNVAIVLL